MTLEQALQGYAEAIELLAERVRHLEAADAVIVIVKATTGDPATGRSGQFVVNTFDNTLKAYGDGGWRQIAMW